MQEEEREGETGGSDGRAMTDACELADPSEWASDALFAGAEEEKGEICSGRSLTVARGGLERCSLLPRLTAASAPCRGRLCADHPSEAAVPSPSARHSTRRPNL